MQYICVTATRDEIRELSFATKWFADLCFTENDRIYRTTELSLQYYQKDSSLAAYQASPYFPDGPIGVQDVTKWLS